MTWLNGHIIAQLRRCRGRPQHQVKGQVKEQWGKLTDDDLDRAEGKRDQIEGAIQARYGYEKDKARDEVDAWFKNTKW